MFETILIPLTFMIGLVVYFVPTMVAAFRNHARTVAIFALNLLLGWSLLGWIGALIWALVRPYQNSDAASKTCAACAEIVKAEARICHYCVMHKHKSRHDFGQTRSMALIVLGLTTLAACSPMPELPAEPSVREFENVVRQTLRDPDSAKFRDGYVFRQIDGSFVACGSVNAKNGYGGYTGYRRFIASRDVVQLDDETAHNIAGFEDNWIARCRDNTPQSYSNASGSPFRSYK